MPTYDRLSLYGSCALTEYNSLIPSFVYYAFVDFKMNRNPSSILGLEHLSGGGQGGNDQEGGDHEPPDVDPNAHRRQRAYKYEEEESGRTVCLFTVQYALI